MIKQTKAILLKENQVLRAKIDELELLLNTQKRIMGQFRHMLLSFQPDELSQPNSTQLMTFQRGFEAMAEAVGSISRMLLRK